MNFTEEQKEYITHCFDSYCTIVDNHCAKSLYRGLDRQIKRNIAKLDEFTQSIQSNTANAIHTRFYNINLQFSEMFQCE